jgi:hypothetical protein
VNQHPFLEKPVALRLLNSGAVGAIIGKSSSQQGDTLRFRSVLMRESRFRQSIDGDAVEEPCEYAILRAA